MTHERLRYRRRYHRRQRGGVELSALNGWWRRVGCGRWWVGQRRSRWPLPVGKERVVRNFYQPWPAIPGVGGGD